MEALIITTIISSYFYDEGKKHEVAYQTRAAVRKKRQGYPCNRRETQVHEDVFGDLEEHHREQS